MPVAVHAAATVVGVGTDLVAVDRLAAALARRPALADRLFTPDELATTAGGSPAGRVRSLAARLAAKEAVMKALGAGMGRIAFADIEITGGRGRSPEVALHGRADAVAQALGVGSVAISMSHDAGLASAVAVASGRCTCDRS